MRPKISHYPKLNSTVSYLDISFKSYEVFLLPLLDHENRYLFHPAYLFLRDGMWMWDNRCSFPGERDYLQPHFYIFLFYISILFC